MQVIASCSKVRSIRLVIAYRPEILLVAAFPSIFAIYTKMSKRKLSDYSRGESLSLDLDEEQIAVLDLLPDFLHPSLKPLVPVLDSLRKAYSDRIPLHTRALPVNTSTLYNYETILTF